LFPSHEDAATPIYKNPQGLSSKLFQYLQTLSFSFYQRTKTGEIMARSINDIMAIRMATGMGLVSFVDGFIIDEAYKTVVIFVPVMGLFSSFTIALIIWHGGGKVISGQLSFGSLVAFVSYIQIFS
jgi:ABC-type multidrug transport system fused ATPase/permease subunit